MWLEWQNQIFRQGIIIMCEAAFQSLKTEYQFKEFCSGYTKSSIPPFYVTPWWGKPLQVVLPPPSSLLGRIMRQAQAEDWRNSLLKALRVSLRISSVLMGSGYKEIRGGRISQYHFHRRAMAIPFLLSLTKLAFCFPLFMRPLAWGREKILKNLGMLHHLL